MRIAWETVGIVLGLLALLALSALEIRWLRGFEAAQHTRAELALRTGALRVAEDLREAIGQGLDAYREGGGADARGLVLSVRRLPSSPAARRPRARIDGDHLILHVPRSGRGLMEVVLRPAAVVPEITARHFADVGEVSATLLTADGRALRIGHVGERSRSVAVPLSRGEGGVPPLRLRIEVSAGELEAQWHRARRHLIAAFAVISALLLLSVVSLSLGARRARRAARQQREFMAAMTHELMTPLAAIRGLSENLADGLVSEPAQIRRYGESIGKEERRLHGMVSEVLHFAGWKKRTQSMRREPIEVTQLVARLVDSFRPRLGERLRAEVAAELPALVGDVELLERALSNLLRNAEKYAGPQARIELIVRQQAKRICFVVRDDGPAPPAQTFRRAFEAFYRGPAARESAIEGAGLGLATVRRIAAAHGGTARLYRENNWTIAEVCIPHG